MQRHPCCAFVGRAHGVEPGGVEHARQLAATVGVGEEGAVVAVRRGRGAGGRSTAVTSGMSTASTPSVPGAAAARPAR